MPRRANPGPDIRASAFATPNRQAIERLSARLRPQQREIFAPRQELGIRDLPSELPALLEEVLTSHHHESRQGEVSPS